MPFLLALTLLFIALKLSGIVAWGWALVLLPMLVIPGAWLLFFLLVLLGCAGVSRRARFEPMTM